jgi:HCOMODA/2-hydroxy-3-carboxy-muconic semialdehyde decarboxylase
MSVGRAELAAAGRALARAGLVHAFGHCSVRVGNRFTVTPARPIGLLSEDDEFPMVDLDQGELPAGVAGEVLIHRAIYRSRQDVNAVCRVQPRNVMTLSVLGRTPRCFPGFGAYFGAGVPLWESPQLVRTSEEATAVAARLGTASAVVLRGNGAVTVAESLPRAVTLAWFLERAADVDLEILKLGDLGSTARELTETEAVQRATWQGGIAERMWEFLTT